jgi:hypothetical protein
MFRKVKLGQATLQDKSMESIINQGGLILACAFALAIIILIIKFLDEPNNN